MKELLDITETWKSSTQQKHKSLLATFSRIFRITEDGCRMKVPNMLRLKACKEWLKGNENLVDMMELQHVTFVYNLVTLDNITYNVLRASRPCSGASQCDINWIDSLSDESAKQCDLCNYKQYTAEDIFGRLESEYAYTAANAFKMDAWHSMVIFRTHHPVNWSLAELVGCFELILQWFEKVHSLSPVHRYPIILWDSLPAAGSSQIHPHIHMMLNQEHYSGELERWHLSAKQYNNKYNRDYWTDLLEVSSALGVSATLGDATAVVNLGSSSDPHQPAFARIVPRGLSNNARSDVCSLELFASPSISVNPLTTASLLQATISENLMSEEKL
ncbi:hypothetical protein LSH36_18g00013 [Paralvinella palmiformis]|uniref:Uncharacterized protein n=1 Tax=Paralvinella palmiformis TaxID=53620 RepID=A0AAD9KBR9_9ANNE|nr:hypothetical protein LSH36_18g00013 [Paralvinella palmiformis]